MRFSYTDNIGIFKFKKGVDILFVFSNTTGIQGDTFEVIYFSQIYAYVLLIWFVREVSQSALRNHGG